MKKTLLILASSIMAATLVGCQSGNNDSKPEDRSSTETKSNEVSTSNDKSVEQSSSEDVQVDRQLHASKFDTTKETHIVFYHTMNKNLQQVLDAYIEDFNLLYPNIIVEHHPIGGYDDVKDQNTQAISSGKNDCDLAYCYPDHIAFYNKANSVFALNEIVDDPEYGFTAEQKADFIEAYWDEGFAIGDGNMYALPLTKSSEVMYYNKTFFEEHDLKVPTTWEEMFDVCEQIKAIDVSSIPLGYDSSSNLFITLAEQTGAGYTSTDPNNRYIFDNETNREVMESFKSFYQLGYMTTKGLYGAYTSGLFTEVGENAQRSYMSIGSSAGATNQIPAIDPATGKRPFEVGIARIPQMDPTHGKVISQGPDICLFNNGDNQKAMATWLFAKFLTTSVEFQAQFSMTSGYTPVLKSVNDNPVYAAWLTRADGYGNLAALSTKTCVDQSEWYFTSPAFVGSSEARTQVENLVDAILSESKTVDQAFKDAITMCNTVK